MVAFVHGVRCVEIDGSSANGWPVATVRSQAPQILSAKIATIDEGDPFSLTLLADTDVSFAIRSGADGASFSLDGAQIELPAQPFDFAKNRFVCPLRALDARGNATDFEIAITIRQQTGQLDFENPANSAL